MKRVLATREGLVGSTTASGYTIQGGSWFVALPSRKALGKVVRLWLAKDTQFDIRPPQGAPYLTAPVLDVGPWNTHDDDYVFGLARPLAELGQSLSSQGTNKAGIDLSNAVFTAIGLTTNGYVWWDFV
jgi:hypothetical protein